MLDIYSKASKVIVWLGPESVETTGAMKAIRFLSAHVEVDWDKRTIKPRLGKSQSIKVTASLTKEPLDVAKYRSLLKLLIQNPWFQRLWSWAVSFHLS